MVSKKGNRLNRNKKIQIERVFAYENDVMQIINRPRRELKKNKYHNAEYLLEQFIFIFGLWIEGPSTSSNENITLKKKETGYPAIFSQYRTLKYFSIEEAVLWPKWLTPIYAHLVVHELLEK